MNGIPVQVEDSTSAPTQDQGLAGITPDFRPNFDPHILHTYSVGTYK
jgi:hypothetical protein